MLPYLVLLASPQIVIFVGYITPMFLQYVIEARHKLRFARRHGLLRGGSTHDRWPLTGMLFGWFIEDSAILAVAYANLMFLTIVAVGVIIQQF